MACKDVREAMIDGRIETPAREHLASCAECQSFARDQELLQASLQSLAKEIGPEPSWGFAARVLRRLDESPAEELEFLEKVGRRAVYVASVVALVVLMALALPSSGPLRGPAAAELSPTSAQASTTEVALFAIDLDESEEVIPLPVALNGVEQK